MAAHGSYLRLNMCRKPTKRSWRPCWRGSQNESVSAWVAGSQHDSDIGISMGVGLKYVLPPFSSQTFYKYVPEAHCPCKAAHIFQKKMSQRSGWRKSSGALVAMKTGKTLQCMDTFPSKLLATLTKCYHSLNFCCLTPQNTSFTPVTEDLKIIRIHTY